RPARTPWWAGAGRGRCSRRMVCLVGRGPAWLGCGRRSWLWPCTARPGVAFGRSSDVHPHPVWVVGVDEVGDPVWAVHGTGDADPVAGEWPVLAADDLAGPIPGWSHDHLLAWG